MLRVLKALLGITLITVAAALAPTAVNAELDAQKASLSGTVVNDARYPTSGVRVYLVFSAPIAPKRSLLKRTVIASTLTDKNGNFAFKNIQSSIYELDFQKDGYVGQMITGVYAPFGEQTTFSAPIILRRAVIYLDDSGLRRSSYCNNLVRPGQTADVYIVCGD